MAKKNLADGFSRFEFRPGVGGFPEWDGLDLRGDASTIAPNRLRVAQNVRFLNKDVIVRGGQSKITSVTITGSVIGISDSDDDQSEKIWGFPPVPVSGP